METSQDGRKGGILQISHQSCLIMLIKNSPNVSVAGEDEIWRVNTVNDEPTNQLDHNDSNDN